MEPLAKTWTVMEQVGSADLNQLQRNAVAMRPAVGVATNSWSTVANGQQGVMFQSESNVANNTVITIDTSLDWRDRVLYGWVLAYGAATYPGNPNDTNMNSGSASLYHFVLYTGTGATDGGAALVSNGNPPAIGYYTDMGVTNVLVFCDTGAGGGKLRIYNSSGATFYTPTVFIYATQDLGKR
jgi:hypothetical protein